MEAGKLAREQVQSSFGVGKIIFARVNSPSCALALLVFLGLPFQPENRFRLVIVSDLVAAWRKLLVPAPLASDPFAAFK